MLFRNKIDKSCAYCAHGVKLDDEAVLCAKKGICPLTGKCRKFKYDPTKRVPQKSKPLDFGKYKTEDFSL